MAKKPSRRRTTIKEIAVEAGISTATVSYVLNQKGAVGADTRARVLAVARDLGYDIRPRSSSSKRTGKEAGVVTLVWVNTSPHWQQSWLSNLLSHTLQAGLQEHGGRLQTIFYNEDGPGGSSIFSGDEAALLIAGRPGADFAAKLPKGVPCLNIICKDYPSPAPSLDIDHVSTGACLTDYLIGQGHKRIGFVSNDRDHPYFSQRYIGYLLSLDRANLPICPEWVVRLEGASSHLIETSEPISTLDDELAALLARIGTPCALIAANDWVASAIYQYAQRNGLSIPKDISVVGCDNDPSICNLLRPGLTTHTVPYEVIGNKAIDWLQTQSDGDEQFLDGSISMLLKGHLVERQSVRAL